MALQPCRECGKDVSTSAKTCPNCGVAKPVKQKMSRGVMWFLGLGLLFIIYQAGTTPGGSGATPSEPRPAPEDDPQFGRFVIDRTRDKIRAGLKDPESVRWGVAEARVIEAGGKSAVVACGSYNSKNSFGGYTGSRRFIGNGGEIGITEEATSAGEFSESWKLMCGGRVLATAPATE